MQSSIPGVYLAIAWQLVSWWPNDNLHLATGLDYGPLLLIEYGFHATVIISALVVARFFLAVLRGTLPGAMGRA